MAATLRVARIFPMSLSQYTTIPTSIHDGIIQSRRGRNNWQRAKLHEARVVSDNGWICDSPARLPVLQAMLSSDSFNTARLPGVEGAPTYQANFPSPQASRYQGLAAHANHC